MFIPKQEHITLEDLNVQLDGGHNILSLYAQPRDPTGLDTGVPGPTGVSFRDATLWVNTLTEDIFFCTNAQGEALWKKMGEGVTLGSIPVTPSILSPSSGSSVPKNHTFNVNINNYTSTDSSPLLRVEVLMSLTPDFSGEVKVFRGYNPSSIPAVCLAEGLIHYAKVRYVSESLSCSEWSSALTYVVQSTSFSIYNQGGATNTSWYPHLYWSETHLDSLWQASEFKSFGPELALDQYFQGYYVAKVHLSQDGTHLYYADYHLYTINQYVLSTPFDVSTATLTNSLDTGALFGTVKILVALSASGDKLLLLDTGAYPRKLYSYTLTSNWDLSTLGASVSVDVPTDAGGIQDFCFSADGSKMYTTGNPAHSAQLSLSTPWDISTLTFEGTFEPGGRLAVYGNRAYFGSDSNVVIQRTYETPWDMLSLRTSEESLQPRGILNMTPFFVDDIHCISGDFTEFLILSSSITGGDLKTFTHEAPPFWEKTITNQLIANYPPTYVVGDQLLDYDKSYYFRAKGYNEYSGWTNWSLIHAIHTAPRNYLSILTATPPSGSINVFNYPEISVYLGTLITTPYIKRYDLLEFQLSTAPDFSSILYSSSTVSPSLDPSDGSMLTVTADVDPDTTYYWRVRGRLLNIPQAGWSDWLSTHSFTTGSLKYAGCRLLTDFGGSPTPARMGYSAGKEFVVGATDTEFQYLWLLLGDLTSSKSFPTTLRARGIGTATVRGCGTTETHAYVAYGDQILKLNRSTLAVEWVKSVPSSMYAMTLVGTNLVFSCGSTVYSVDSSTFSGVTRDFDTYEILQIGKSENHIHLYCVNKLIILNTSLAVLKIYSFSKGLNSVAFPQESLTDFIVSFVSEYPDTKMVKVEGGVITAQKTHNLVGGAYITKYGTQVLGYSESSITFVVDGSFGIQGCTRRGQGVQGTTLHGSEGISIFTLNAETIGIDAYFDLNFSRDPTSESTYNAPTVGSFGVYDLSTSFSDEAISVTITEEADTSTSGVYTLSGGTPITFHIVRGDTGKVRLYQ